MCNKSHMTKRFFVLLNHPFPLQKALVLGVVKDTPQSQHIFEATRNPIYLTPHQIKCLGIKPSSTPETYMVPIQIPRDWFLH